MCSFAKILQTERRKKQVYLIFYPEVQRILFKYIKKKALMYSQCPFSYKMIIKSDKFHATADECSQSLTLKHSVLQESQIYEFMYHLVAGGIFRIDA